MGLTYCSWLLAIVGLIPFGLYLLGRIRDPFHPMIFMGILSTAVVANPLIKNHDEAILILDESLYIQFTVFTLFCVLAMYLGWFWGGRSTTERRDNLAAPELRDGAMLSFGFMCSLVGTSVFYLTYERWDLTGYLREWAMLWITAAILLVQVMLYSPNRAYRLLASPCLLFALIPPLNRFFVYGQRGDTFRIAVILMLVFFCKKKRPSKPVFIVVVYFFRHHGHAPDNPGMVENGESINRLDALVHVVPHFFERMQTDRASEDFNTGAECVFGPASMATVSETGRYGYGTGLTTGLITRFLPRGDLFDKEHAVFSIPHAGYDANAILAATGITIPAGSAFSGFANAFCELGWLGWVVWVLIGYFFCRLWKRAILVSDPRAQGYLAGYFIACLYAVTQDLVTAEVNIIFVFIPLYFIYKFATVKPVFEALPVLSA